MKKLSFAAAYFMLMLGFSNVGAAFPGSDVRRVWVAHCAGHVLLLLLAGRGKAGHDIGRWPLLVPLPVRPCLTTSARWYLWPQQPSESLFQVVVVATGGVWGGRWCL